MTLDDVLNDTSQLPALLENILVEKYADIRFSDLQETFEDYLTEDAFSWTLGYQGITFYFSPYEIASFADGPLTAAILFDEMPELFISKYTETPDSYTISICLQTAGSSSLFGAYDLDGDGEADELYIDAEPDEYDYYDSFSITLKGGSISEDCYAYEISPYLLHTASGKSYLYVDSLSDSEYETLRIYDLNGEAPALVGTLDGSGFHSSQSEETGLMTALPVTPEYFVLDTCIDLLGTMTGTRAYYADDKDGMPVPLTSYYEIGDGFVLESKVPLELTLPEEEKTETFQAGTQFTCFRTDNAAYVDMKLSDGRICRVEVETDDGQTQVGGMDVNDVFDGIVSAG